MIIGLIFIAVGGIAIFVGISILQKRKSIIINGVTTEGIVFSIEQDEDPRTINVFPVIRFTTLKDEWITERSPLSYKPGLYKSGGKVKIIYDPDNPKSFILDDTTNKLAPYLFIVVGGIFLILGLLGISEIIKLNEWSS